MSRPDIPNGFLGGQPRFGEVKLQVDSHPRAEFKVNGDNNVRIKLKTGTAVKTVTKLTQCAGDKELSGFVMTQRKQGALYFDVGFPENGWYKFSIFAIEESNPSEQLPGVYNYLIQVEGSNKPAQPYVKIYTKFYADYCFLDEPKWLRSGDPKLNKVKFEVKVPGAKKVAVHAGEEWFQLTKKGDEWEGTADLSQCKNTKVTVNGNYDSAGTSYSVLLEYNI